MNLAKTLYYDFLAMLIITLATGAYIIHVFGYIEAMQEWSYRVMESLALTLYFYLKDMEEVPSIYKRVRVRKERRY